MCFPGQYANHDDCVARDANEINARSLMSIDRRLFPSHTHCRLVPSWSDKPLHSNYLVFSRRRAPVIGCIVKVSPLVNDLNWPPAPCSVSSRVIPTKYAIATIRRLRLPGLINSAITSLKSSASHSIQWTRRISVCRWLKAALNPTFTIVDCVTILTIFTIQSLPV